MQDGRTELAHAVLEREDSQALLGYLKMHRERLGGFIFLIASKDRLS